MKPDVMQEVFQRFVAHVHKEQLAIGMGNGNGKNGNISENEFDKLVQSYFGNHIVYYFAKEELRAIDGKAHKLLFYSRGFMRGDTRLGLEVAFVPYLFVGMGKVYYQLKELDTENREGQILLSHENNKPVLYVVGRTELMKLDADGEPIWSVKVNHCYSHRFNTTNNRPNSSYPIGLIAIQTPLHVALYKRETGEYYGRYNLLTKTSEKDS